MPLFSPVLALAADYRSNVYINGSTSFSGLGLFRSAHSVNKKAQFQVQAWPILLKTIANKWYQEHQVFWSKKSRVAENTGFRLGACP